MGKRLTKEEMDRAELNWFERMMNHLMWWWADNFGKKTQMRRRVKESAEYGAAKERYYDYLVTQGEAQLWEVLENLVAGRRVTNLEANIRWFNEMRDAIYRGEKRGQCETHHFDIVGEYNSLGLPNGRAKIYRINGPRELQRMRAKGV